MFRSLFRRARYSPHSRSDATHGRVRLNLQTLESREVPTFFTVDTPSDTPVANKLTLREAIVKANGDNNTPHTINFALTAGENVITIGDQLPAITCEISIVGTIAAQGADGPPTDNRVTIQRDPENEDLTDKFRLFEVTAAGMASFQSLKMLNAISPGDGGAIRSFGLKLTVTGCDIINNSALGSGGGIAAFDGILEISKSSISGNNAREGHGGGIWFAGSQIQVSKSVIALNFAGYTGGGISITSDLRPVAAVLDKVEIVGNITEGDNGAGIWSSATTLLLTGDTFIHNNIGADKGGGIFLASGKTTIAGVRLGPNQAKVGKGAFVAVGAQVVTDENLGGLQLYGGDDVFVDL